MLYSHNFHLNYFILLLFVHLTMATINSETIFCIHRSLSFDDDESTFLKYQRSMTSYDDHTYSSLSANNEESTTSCYTHPSCQYNASNEVLVDSKENVWTRLTPPNAHSIFKHRENCAEIKLYSDASDNRRRDLIESGTVLHILKRRIVALK
jgi:hypothetical protein